MNKFLIVLSILLAFSVATSAQEFNFNVSVGGGSYFSDEDVTFDPSALFGAVQLNAIQLPIFDTSSGVGAEINFSIADNQIGYVLWNLNRAEIIAGKVYGGPDMKFLSNTSGGIKGDFDLRITTGVYLGTFSDGGKLNLEFYTLEENKPIAFALLYRF